MYVLALKVAKFFRPGIKLIKMTKGAKTAPKFKTANLKM